MFSNGFFGLFLSAICQPCFSKVHIDKKKESGCEFQDFLVYANKLKDENTVCYHNYKFTSKTRNQYGF